MKDSVNQSESTRVVTVGPKQAVPSHEAISQRAYDIYVAKGRTQGQCKQNWRQAENDLQSVIAAKCDERESGGSVSPVPHAGCTMERKAGSGVAAAMSGGRGSSRSDTTTVRPGGRDHGSR